MGRFPQPGCCCSEVDTNCLARMLEAKKTRFGFPPIYVNGANKFSRRRYLEKRLRYRLVQSDFPDRDYLYAYTIRIDRLTGKVTFAETIEGSHFTPSLGDFATACRNAAHSDTSGVIAASVASGSISTPIVWSTNNYDVTFSANGNAVTSFFARMDNASGFNEFSVEIADEYTDEMLNADLLELLTGFSTSPGAAGLDGVADNSFVKIRWNENGIETALLANSTNAQRATTISSLSSYTTPLDPEIVLTVIDTAMDLTPLLGGLGPGFTPYLDGCEFENIKPVASSAVTDANFEVATLRAWQINVSTDICATFNRVDTTATTSSICVLAEAPQRRIFEPFTVALSDTNIERPNNSGSNQFLFTTPGALTAGDCPCTVAP